MADEILKFIVTSDPSKFLGDMKQVEAAANKVGAATKGAGQDASQGLAPLNKMVDETRQALNKLHDSTKQLRSSKTGGSALADSLLGVEQKAKGGISALGLLGSAGRALGVGFGIYELVKQFNAAIDATNELRASQLGLQAVARNLGVDMFAATGAAQSLTKDGFLSIADSSKGLQNLLASGLNLQFATELMNKNKDAAIFNRQSHLGLSESIKVFTDGFKNEISTLTDATGVSTNYGRALEDTFKLAKAGQLDYAQYRDILTSTEIAHVRLAVAHTGAADKLDKQSKSILAGIGFLKELDLFTGNAAKGADLLAVSQQKFANTLLETRAAFGEQLTPGFREFLVLATELLSLLPKLTKGFSELVPTIPFSISPIKALSEGIGLVNTRLTANAGFQRDREIMEQLEAEYINKIGPEGPQRLQALQARRDFGSLGRSGYLVELSNQLEKAQRAESATFRANFPFAPNTLPKAATAAQKVVTTPEEIAKFKAITAAREAVDEQISSLNRKALSGIAAQFDEIDQRFRKIVQGEFKTGGAARPGVITAAEQAATAAKMAARNELFAKAGLNIFEEGGAGVFGVVSGKGIPSNEDIQKDINATLEVSSKAYVTQIDNEFKLKEAMSATEMERLSRIGNMQAEIEVMDAAAMGRNKHESQWLELLAQQKQARAAVSDADTRAVLEQFQGRKQLELLRNQYDETFDKIRTQAEGVFDAIFLRGKKGFAGLLDYIKGIFITQLKDAFGKLVASIFAGPRPGGARAEGGLFGGIASLFSGRGGATGGGGGLFGGLGGLFGGGGGIAGTPPFLPTRGGFGGLGSLLGLGGTGASLAAGGAALTPGVAAVLPTTFANTGLTTVTGAGGAAAGGGGAFGISGATLGAFFTNPFTIAAGIGIAATIAFLKLRKSREDKFRQEILRDFALNVPDMKLLKQIRSIGESAFGKDADRKRFETLRLSSVQSMLMSYAQASGQDPFRLPLYQKFFGGAAAAGQRFDPRQGVPAFGSGGVVTSPTLAMIGERGPEAVVPLSQFGGSTIIHVTVNESKNPKETSREVVRGIGNLLGRDIGRRAFRNGLLGV